MKYIYCVILGFCLLIVSCNRIKSEEDLLLDGILNDLNNDCNYPLESNVKLNDLDKLMLIDSLVTVRYTKEDFSSYLCTHRKELDSNSYTILFNIGLYINKEETKNVEIYYHGNLIEQGDYDEKMYQLNLKPEKIGRDSIYVIINMNNKDYADVLYFDVVE